MKEPKSIYTKTAAKAIISIFNKEAHPEGRMEDIPDDLNIRRACFVSLHMRDGSLRGCIGTIEPQRKNLYEEITRNALSAAQNDSRFLPLKESELDDLELSVDVLSEPVEIMDICELDPKKFGIIVSDDGFRRGVLLPNIEGIDTVEEQINITKRKAGIYQADNQMLTIKKFTSTRYY